MALFCCLYSKQTVENSIRNKFYLHLFASICYNIINICVNSFYFKESVGFQYITLPLRQTNAIFFKVAVS